MMKKFWIAAVICICVFVLVGCGGTEMTYEEKEIETKLINTFESTSDNFLSDEVHKNLIDAMETSEAQFFYIEIKDDRYYSLYQTDMETFNEKGDGAVDAKEASKTISKGLTKFLNSSYNGMGYEAQDWFHPMSCSLEEVSATFNNERPVEYFKNNSLKLSCEAFNVTKIALFEHEPADNGTITYDLYVLGSADVTTKEKIGATDKYFAPEGESKNITIKALCYTSNETNFYDIMRMFIE